jgi:hypothetical protein
MTGDDYSHGPDRDGSTVSVNSGGTAAFESDGQ